MTPTVPADHKRPTTGGKSTARTEKARDEALDAGMKLTIEGESYEARVGDVTPELARELRSNIGMGFLKLCNTIADDPDIDLLSAFVWVARRITGERIEFDQVSVSYAQMLDEGFDVSLPGAEDLDGDDPEL